MGAVHGRRRRYNLQYRTQNDDKVRPEHAAILGVTLTPAYPFWEEFYPTNGWDCRCTVVQVRKSKYPVTPHDEAMRLGDEALQRDKKGMFRFNPGIEGKTVPDYNPYTISKCRSCPIAKGGINNLVYVPENELCAGCRIVRALANADAKQIKKEAKPLQGSSISNPKFAHQVKITRTSLKEWTNQPHKHYSAKNRLLLNIREVFASATYLGPADNHKGISGLAHSHVFEINLCNEPSLIIVREYDWGEYILHSISDSLTLYEHIKKK